MQRHLIGTAALLSVVAAISIGSTGIASATPSAPPERVESQPDFNGDRIADLAIGVPFEDQTGADDGAVNVIYGTAAGLNAAGNQVWDQDSAGIGGVREAGDRFGASLAVGDFDGDRFTDLAIGVPYEDQTGANDGAVNVIYGSAGGLNAAGNQVWDQDSAGIGGVRESGDNFGASLAAGDFNGDGFADLAIGVPNEDQTGTDDGAVNIIYGSAAGLNAAGNQVWDQDSAGIGGVREAGDRFGTSLAAANFGNSSHTDLAIGVPFEDQTGAEDGAVNVIYGSAGGLNAAGNQVWDQDSAGIGGVREPGDTFGYSLAAANLGNSTHADLAIGVPLEDQTGADDGAVNVIYGSAAGLNAAGNQVWDQDSAGIGGVREPGDRFGYSLAAADFGNTGFADLAIGVPNEDQTGLDDGAVNVIYGSAGGLNSAGNQVWDQDSAGIGGVREAGDRFGTTLTARNLGNSTHADLAIGVPGEDQTGADDGAVNVIYGSAAGLNAAGEPGLGPGQRRHRRRPRSR